MRLNTRLRSTSRIPLLQALKTSAAVALGWILSQLLLDTEQLPVFAAIAALLVVQPNINQTLGRAVERSLGVIGGVIIAYGVGVAFGQSSWVVLLAIVFCIMLAWALRLAPSSASQIPISAMLLLTIGTATAEYARDRIVETIIGAAAALLVNALIVPPVLLAPAHAAVVRLAYEIADTLDRIVDALRFPQKASQIEEMMIKVRLLRPMLAKADQALKQAEESLTLNPRHAVNRRLLDVDEELFARLTSLVARTIGMTRSLRDHYDHSLHLEPTVLAITVELSRAAHDLRLLAEQVDHPSAQQVSVPLEPPTLTAPLIIATPHPQHWILIGSLMEDLRRVREEIKGE
ncbi:FUSC family protein [Cryobacterium cheniae]|uniref:FUSC family protein n=1 Tax=Cryobacterium cheniae TaxID=1259262 RepID=A0A4R8XLK9_9MICO|nr:FUSC family protein [Cryobacterium cheniae]TFC78368.1 FUSC family protein [Cryobacterium cheniae]